jgi:hypothetical protein
MVRHVSAFLLGALLFQGSAQADSPTEKVQPPPQAQAEAKADTRSGWQKVAERMRPSVSLYYARAIAPEEFSDFRHSMGVGLGLGYTIDPTLIAKASISIDRELGVPIEAFRASNTRLSLTKNITLPKKIGLLSSVVFGNLPTNDERREYLSYRGSLGAGVALINDRVFTFRNNIHAIGGGVSLVAARNFFEFTHSLEGAYTNRLTEFGGGVQLVYTLYDRLSFIASFENYMLWNYAGRTNDQYDLTAAVQYVTPQGIRISLRTTTEDFTFQQDQVTANVHLYKPENTLVFFTIGYAPVYETVTQ